MTADATTQTTTGTSGRRRSYLLAAAVGAALLTAGSSVAWGAAAHQAAAAPLVLTVQESPGDADCEPEVKTLRRYTTAFEGTVTENSVEGDTATLRVNHWYRGGHARTVQLKASEAFPASIGVKLVAGQHYLLPAEGGFVPQCLLNKATPKLRELYKQAYTNVAEERSPEVGTM